MKKQRISAIVLDEDIQANRDFMFNEIKDDARIKEFLLNYELDHVFLKDNIQAFHTWIKTINLAKQCEHSETCYIGNGGYYEDLYYDGLLQKRLVPCAHQEQRIKNEQFLKNYIVMDFPESLIDVTMADIVSKDEPLEYMKLVAEVASYLDRLSGPGYYIHGEVGVGKTYLMSAISNELAKLGKTVAFVHTPTLSNDLKSMISRHESLDNLMYRLKNADVLVFDDIGSEGVSDWLRDDILLSILNYRMESNKTCFYTSNLSVEELQNHYAVNNRRELNELAAQRLLERVKMTSKEVRLIGKNRRDFAK